MTRSPTPQRRRDALDVALAATLLVLGTGTFLLLATPLAPPRVLAPALDLALDTVALVVTSLVALLAWVRYGERREGFAFYQAAAFLAFAAASGHAVLVTLTLDGAQGFAAARPGQEQPWVFAAAATIGAVLLAAGGEGSVLRHRPRRPAVVIGLTAVAMVAVIAFSDIVRPLPELVSGSGAGAAGLVVTPLGSGIHLLNAGLFGVAAIVGRSVWRRDRAVGDAYVTIGVIIAAFAEVHAAAFPSTHPGPVTSVDLLRLAFAVVLLLAVEAEARRVMGSLRVANATLERLRAAEVERAALEERSRLSRELHDGLAQALWLAKLKVGRLAATAGFTSAGRILVDEASEAVDVALAEARQAVMALRTSADASDSFCDLLARCVDDFVDRFGLRVEMRCVLDSPDLPPRMQAELLRIAQEALTNVHRHADATLVRLRVAADDGVLRLCVEDDGRGFDRAVVSRRSFGLASMSERAALIGGTLAIDSSPAEGTRITVVAPLSPAAVPAAVG
jgi:signal transduction histidine kinase